MHLHAGYLHCRKMNGLLFFGLVATALGVAHATYKSSDFTDAERWEATQQGVQHAHAKVQFYKETQARAAAASNPSDLSAMMLAKFFRRASPRTEKIGHARVFIEEAVKQTERTLFEKKRANIASVASQEEKAEILAAELFHKPGSLLSEKEYAHIYEQSECRMLTEAVDCNSIQFVNTIRTPDGTCNNLMNPTQGASATPFGRLLPPRYEDGLFMPNGLRQSKFRDHHYRNGSAFSPPYPSARLVSINIIRDREDDAAVNTHLLMQWGQFVDHDLDLSVEFRGAEEICRDCAYNEMCAPIPIPEDDQDFGVATPRGGGCLIFARTVPACPNDPSAFVPREQVNELTHYIDGSMVYGSTAEVANFLRQNVDGLLKVSDPLPGQNMDNLPEIPATDERPCPRERATCFVAGDVRVNEQLSLTVMHTVWLREHNRIARELKRLNPGFDDERLYQDSRRIVIAQIQQIIFEEYLPIILGPTSDALLGPYPGYQSNVDVFIPNAFATAAYRFGHSQIQPQFDRLESDFSTPISRGPLSLVDAFMNPQEFFDGGGTDPIVRGWVTQPARKLDEFLNSILTSQLFEIEPGMGMDLAALNVQRGRDHGLPPYLVWKNYCEDRFEMSSDFKNELTKIRLLQTYGSLDTVDLFVGALAEEPLPGAQVGATLACIFAITFSRLRDGDRFWYKNLALNVFSEAQLAEIERTSLSRVLCDNTNIGRVQRNPFQQSQIPQRCGGFGGLGIPGIRFDPAFVEDPFCYMAIKVDPPGRPNLNIDVVSAQASNTDVFDIFKISDATPQRYCAPIRCPNSFSSTLIQVFPPFTQSGDTSNFDDCVVTVMSAPPNAPNNFGTSVYEAIFTPSDIQANGNGLYTTNAQCESDSSTIAISYMCAPVDYYYYYYYDGLRDVTTADLEDELARILSDTSDTPAKSQTNTRLETYTMERCVADPTIPDEICREIEDFRNNPSKAVKASEEVQGNSDRITQELVTESEDKTEELKLINLLEATLQELKDN